MITVLRMPQVVRRTGLSAPTIYRRMAEGTFPPSRMKIGERARGWVEAEIDDWLADREHESAEQRWQGKKPEEGDAGKRDKADKPAPRGPTARHPAKGRRRQLAGATA
jgi:prophage regulatory protein